MIIPGQPVDHSEYEYTIGRLRSEIKHKDGELAQLRAVVSEYEMRLAKRQEPRPQHGSEARIMELEAELKMVYATSLDRFHAHEEVEGYIDQIKQLKQTIKELESGAVTRESFAFAEKTCREYKSKNDELQRIIDCLPKSRATADDGTVAHLQSTIRELESKLSRVVDVDSRDLKAKNSTLQAKVKALETEIMHLKASRTQPAPAPVKTNQPSPSRIAKEVRELDSVIIEAVKADSDSRRGSGIEPILEAARIANLKQPEAVHPDF